MQLPLPPPWFRVLVHGSAEAEYFLDVGVSAVRAIEQALDDAGSSLAEKRSILDFGCGCGRVLRHLGELHADLYGVDVNARLARWCQENIPFARCSASTADPPLAFPPESFDLIYAVSVFTHLPESDQLGWLAEIRRLLTPDGHLVLTVAGDAHRSELTKAERERFDGGQVVVRHARAGGRNACIAVHPPEYLRTVLGPILPVVAFRPCGLDRQDVWVVARRSDALTT